MICSIYITSHVLLLLICSPKVTRLLRIHLLCDELCYALNYTLIQGDYLNSPFFLFFQVIFKNLLVKKDDLKKIYNEWKYLKEKKEINSKNPDKINKIELLNNNIIIQNEINNLPNQSEEEELNIFKKEQLEKEKLLNDKKNNLLKEINNPTNNTLIEIQPNKLINSSLYNQIINSNEEKDEYIIPEYLTKNNIPVSKKNLKSINLSDENQCIILEELTKKKKIILRINEIKTKINSENKQILKSYEGNDEEINLLNLNILKIEDEKLPEEKNNPENENIKKFQKIF